VKVLVATRNLAVFDALQGLSGLEYDQALFTGEIYDALQDVQLVIVDFDDLVEHPYSVGMLRGILADSDRPFVSSDEFLADPGHWLEEARRVGGVGTELPDKRTVAFVSYSGGVGKTVLAMDTAVHFARRTREKKGKPLPVLLLEFTYGESSLQALVGANIPPLFELATQPDVNPAVWNEVKLVPMDYDNSRDLSIQLLGKYLKDLMRDHVLTVIDSQWPHALIGAVRDEIDQWFVVASPRPDAVENARKLAAELGTKATVVVNMKSGVGDSLALYGIERAVDLPKINQADRFEGKLGRQLLEAAFGPQVWRQYEKESFLNRLFGRRAERKAA
jgi:hypothetical protein